MNVFIKYLISILRPTRAALVLLLAFGLCSPHQPSFAQNKDHPILQNTRAKTDSLRGYWQLKTLAKTRTTVVQFFGPGEQLIYQESLPEKWVKPTRRNRRQFDRLLKDLLANELVTTRIKTETLRTFLPEHDQPVPRLKLATNESQVSSFAEKPYMVHALVNQDGRLRLVVDNPFQHRYRIDLKNKGGALCYQEYNNIAQYRRWLDISALGTEPYTLTVHIDGQKIQYELNNQQAKRVYRLESLVLNQ